MHIHTNQPGVVITLGQKYGELQTMKVDNMKLQHAGVVESIHNHAHERKVRVVDFQQLMEKEKEAVIAVCFGDGIKQTFME